MITAVDTNILLDILDRDPEFLAQSREVLAESVSAGVAIVCEAVCGELAARVRDESPFLRFLADTGLRLESSGFQTLYLAGQTWRQYTERRPRSLMCPQCGSLQDVACATCGNQLRLRQHLVADFLIGVHASLQADRLLTRDRGFYGAYFPDLTLA